MQTFRSRCARVGAVGAALVLGVAGLSLISAIPASAAPTPTPVNEFFSFAGPTGFGQLGTTGAAGSPTTASQGSNFAITIPGGSQAVPTNQSGVAVNFISGVTQFYEIPSGSTFVNATGGTFNWSGGTGADPSGSGTLVVTDCVSAATPNCTAHNNAPLSNTGGTYSGFDGPNPTFPYLEVSTGTTPIGAGATLTLPTVTVTLTASGAVGTALNWVQFEFDTSANITLFGNPITAAIVAWPSKLEYDTTTTPACNGLTPSGTPPSCPSVTFLPLNAVNATGTATGTLDSGLEYGPATPRVLTTTTISAPAPFINVTNAPPINSTATGVTIMVSGANWPVSTSGTLVWSGCPTGAACSDTGTFTVSAAGSLTGSILFGPNEQLSTSQNPITLTLTATDGAASAVTQATVNPFQSFKTTCSVGPVSGLPPLPKPAPPAGAPCTVNQTIAATVIGTALTISEVQTAPNGSASAVTLSPVTLGIAGTTGCPAVPGTACNNTEFAHAQGLLNAVVVDDNRGTLSGWDVTGQLGGDFINQSPVGPSLDNTIPADFLTWQPDVVLFTAGGLPGNNLNTIGCPNAPGGTPSCDGPSGLPSTTGTAGGAGGNGTGAAVASTSAPAEVTPGPIAVLNNPAGSAKELCGTQMAPGGGGGFVCDAGLQLAVPPYVAAGTYQATMNLTVIGY